MELGLSIRGFNVSNPSEAKTGTKSKHRYSSGKAHFALAREILFIYKQLLTTGAIRLPLGVLRSLVKDPGLDPIWSEKRLLELLGDIVIASLNELGPVYGKFGQIALSRLDEEGQAFSQRLHLDRLYSSWPPIPFSEVESILDEEIPEWHQEFVLEPHPLGVASMAQVHAAVDEQGREWVIKVIKPASRKRLEQTLAAVQEILTVAAPLKLTALGARTHRELEELVRSLRREVELDLEKDNIQRMRSRLEQKKQQVLKLPRVYEEFSTRNVLVIERFRGIPLGSVVQKKTQLNEEQRKKLAKKLLQELLIQVFEIGIFHGDPHAGNLMLLEDGSVGIFDWGLTGELLDTDRKHISGILKALLLVDMDRLIDVFVSMADQHQVKVERSAIADEIRKVSVLIQAHRAAGTQPALDELLEAALSGAERLAIPLPDGLLLMAKSLLTIEGLARGIDPEVSFARAAGPVLLRAAKPTISEILSMGKRVPGFVKKTLMG